MSYRRSEDDSPASARWLRKHRAELVACGLPEPIVGSERSFGYVLLHGDDAPGTGWDPSCLSVEEAERLLEFLVTEQVDETGHGLFRELRARVASNGGSSS